MQRVKTLLFVFMVAAQLPGISEGPAWPTLLAVPAAAGSEQALAIVVNQSNPVENCSMEELRKIFMGERSHWPNGRRITVVMLDPALPERKTVLRDIYGMTEKELNSHFIQGVFTGTVLVAPKTMATPAEVRKFVFNVPGAIGYIRAAEVDNSVKVLRVDGRLPDDKDYRFRLQSHAAKP
jgi:ABC-type phosphate transport system substrate-binding protein